MKIHQYKLNLFRNKETTHYYVYSESSEQAVADFLKLHLGLTGSFSYVKNGEYGDDNAYVCLNGGFLTVFANRSK